MKRIIKLIFCIFAVSIALTQTSKAINVDIQSAAVSPSCSVIVAGKVDFSRRLPATAVSIDLVLSGGFTQRLVTNQILGPNGAFAFSSQANQIISIPQNASVRVTTNRQISATAPLTACTPVSPVPVNLTLAQPACNQVWTDGFHRYGSALGGTPASCQSPQPLSQQQGFLAAAAFCKAYSLPWFNYVLSGESTQSGSLTVTCEAPPPNGDWSQAFISLTNASMSNFGLWSQLHAAANANDFVAAANSAGYSLTLQDIPTIPSPSRHANPLSACGTPGAPPCRESTCAREMYIPVASWFSNNATMCIEHENVDMCNGGYMLPSNGGYQDPDYPYFVAPYDVKQSTWSVHEGVCTPPVVTVQDALAAGCRPESSIAAIMTSAASAPNLGSDTKKKLSDWQDGHSATSGWMTTLDVTDPETALYRATTRAEEDAAFLSGNLVSKAQMALKKLKPSQTPEWFWGKNGPELTDPTIRNDSALAFQVLALSTSDSPRSQFLSVALDFQTAASFGNIVYAFRANPNSPILGMKSCSLGSGEVQFQVPPEPITHVRKYVKSEDAWYAPVNGAWVKQPPSDQCPSSSGDCH